MRILFVSFAMPPNLYPQSIQIGRFLKALKNYNDLKIVVLTADDDSNIDENLYPDLFDGLEVIKIKYKTNKYVNYIKNRFLSYFYQRPDIFRSWMHKAYKKITSKYKPNDFDVILTFSYPLSTNVLGKELKNYFNCKWIAHNSDPWVENPYNSHSKYLLKLNNNLESQCFKAADLLLFTSKETSELYIKKYPKLALKINYINHSFDSDLYNLTENKNDKERKLVIRYIGSLYGKRTAKPLFESFLNFKKAELEKFRVELIGAGQKTNILLKQYDLANVVVKPPVSYLESLRLMKESDCLLVIDAPNNDVSVFFPSKLADYIGSKNRLVGIVPNGTSNRIIRSFQGECCDPQDISGIYKCIYDLIYSGDKNCNISKDKYHKYSIEYNAKILYNHINLIIG